MGSLYLFFARKWADKSIDEIRIRKLGHLASVFFLNGEQAGGERLVPFDGKRGDVADDAREFFDSGVAGKRNGIETGGADGGATEELIEREAALVPALEVGRGFEGRKAHGGITGADRADFFLRGREYGGG